MSFKCATARCMGKMRGENESSIAASCKGGNGNGNGRRTNGAAAPRARTMIFRPLFLCDGRTDGQRGRKTRATKQPAGNTSTEITNEILFST